MTGEQLRQRRLRQGITQQEVVSRLQQLAWARERQRVGVNADMLSKWERGEKRPSALYRRLLCALYSAAPAELGFAPDSGAGVGRAGVPREGARTGGRPGLLDQLGDGVDVLHAQLRDMWAEEFMRRRELLQLMGLAPLVATPDALTGASWGAKFRGRGRSRGRSRGGT